MSTYFEQSRAGRFATIGSQPKLVADHDSAPITIPPLVVPLATIAMADARPLFWLSFPTTPYRREGAGDGNAIV